MRNNGFILVVFTVISGIIFIGRLLYLQVIDDSYLVNPLNNAAVTAKYDYPSRGYIYDRNKKLLVANQLSYDIVVVPRDIKNIDTLEFCAALSITKDYYIKKLTKANKYSSRLSSVFIEQLSKKDYAKFQEVLYKYPGFYVQKRMLRDYPYRSAANVLGYISQVNERLVKENPFYQMGELIGYQGIEKQYEKELRGIKGVKYIKKNIYNKEIGSYKHGSFDTVAIVGKDIQLSLDIQLQEYGESLMKNKRGGIVAIEPGTGEILALITAPSYDPNLMVGRERSKNFNRLYLDSIEKPLFDRSLQAQYSPGSTFKMLVGLVALQEGVIDQQSTSSCYGGYKYGVRSHAFMRCHCGTGGVPMRLNRAIYKSCNTYFSKAYRKSIEKYPTPQEGMNNWSNKVKKFGLGQYLGYDLPVGQKGLIPDADYYDKYYPMKNWKAVTSISNAIGQGEILTTPIQLANMTCAIANRGYYFTPHLAKKIDNQPIVNPKYTFKNETGVASHYFDAVIEGMYKVFEQNGGTAYYSKVKDISICGKTGTVENFIRINGEKISLADHSIFIAFAPKENPKIALAVFIENGGFGSTVAAPIASLMIEKYINGTIKNEWREKRIFDKNLYLEQYNKQMELLKEDE